MSSSARQESAATPLTAWRAERSLRRSLVSKSTDRLSAGRSGVEEVEETMSRSLLTLRVAEPSDASALADLWADALRRADHRELVADVEMIIKTASASPEQRSSWPTTTAAWRAQSCSASRRSPRSIWSPPCRPCLAARVRAVPPARDRSDADGERRRRSPRRSASPTSPLRRRAGSRDANRFMARLALGPHATLRIAPTHVVRAKLTAQRPPMTARAPTAGSSPGCWPLGDRCVAARPAPSSYCPDLGGVHQGARDPRGADALAAARR